MLKRDEIAPGNYIWGKSVDGHQDIVVQVIDNPEAGIVVDTFTAIQSGNGVEIVHKPSDEATLPYAWADPIVITEKWLTKLGFTDEGDSWEDDLGEVYFDGKSFAFVYNTQRIAGIQYVHHLQLAYYGLTEKYLEIKR